MALTPGQRIDAKKRIAETLGQQGWAHIDLTLGEFGFPTTENWRGVGGVDYVLDMLRESKRDEALVDLDAYLHPADAPIARRNRRLSRTRQSMGRARAAPFRAACASAARASPVV
jgi:hypothetical protein